MNVELSLWGIDANNIWAVQQYVSGFLKWDGASWTFVPGPSEIRTPNGGIAGVGFYDVWGTDAHNLWFVGVFGEVLKFDGNDWSVQAGGTLEDLKSVWGADANNIWAVGGWFPTDE